MVKKKYIIIGAGAGLAVATGVTLYIISRIGKVINVPVTTQQPTTTSTDVIPQVQLPSSPQIQVTTSSDVVPQQSQQQSQSQGSQQTQPKGVLGAFITIPGFSPPPSSSPVIYSYTPLCTCPEGTTPLMPGQYFLAKTRCNAPPAEGQCHGVYCVPTGGWESCWNNLSIQLSVYQPPQSSLPPQPQRTTSDVQPQSSETQRKIFIRHTRYIY